MTQRNKDYNTSMAGRLYYYRSPVSIGLEHLGYAILATVALAVLGAILVVALGDWRDTTSWRLVLLLTALPWLILAWGQVRRLVHRQIYDMARYNVTLTQSAAQVLDVTPAIESPRTVIRELSGPSPDAAEMSRANEEIKIRALAERLFHRHCQGLPTTREVCQRLGLCQPKDLNSAISLAKACGLRKRYSWTCDDLETGLMILEEQGREYRLEDGEWVRFRFDGLVSSVMADDISDSDAVTW